MIILQVILGLSTLCRLHIACCISCSICPNFLDLINVEVLHIFPDYSSYGLVKKFYLPQTDSVLDFYFFFFSEEFLMLDYCIYG